jgi:hypothetical protein
VSLGQPRHIWQRLRQESNVELHQLRMEGTSTQGLSSLSAAARAGYRSSGARTKAAIRGIGSTRYLEPT